MAEFICTACGYEGKPSRALNDSAGEDKSFIVGFFEKLVFVLTFLPIKFGWVERMVKRKKAKTCPNCGLPVMVKLNSDAGWLAKRKHDIRSGLIVVDENGKVIPGAMRQVLPQQVVMDAKPDPGKLGALGEQAPVVEEKQEEVVEKPIEKSVTKKPVNPDEW